jgi:hypothetical protein
MYQPRLNQSHASTYIIVARVNQHSTKARTCTFTFLSESPKHQIKPKKLKDPGSRFVIFKAPLHSEVIILLLFIYPFMYKIDSFYNW